MSGVPLRCRHVLWKSHIHNFYTHSKLFLWPWINNMSCSFNCHAGHPRSSNGRATSCRNPSGEVQLISQSSRLLVWFLPKALKVSNCVGWCKAFLTNKTIASSVRRWQGTWRMHQQQVWLQGSNRIWRRSFKTPTGRLLLQVPVQRFPWRFTKGKGTKRCFIPMLSMRKQPKDKWFN